MKKIILFFLVSGFIILILAGCAHKPKKVTIGIVPSSNPAEMIKNFQPMKGYLEKEMGVTIAVVIPKDYYGLIRAMKEKKVDIGLYGPFSYVMAERELKLEPMVIKYKKGMGTSYHSLIIARKNSGIKTIEDLKGKRVAFVDPGSTSGFVFPFALFSSRNIDIKQYFALSKFSGSHDNVVLDVLNGKVDAGAADDLVFNKMMEAGQFNKDDLVVVWKSEPIPASPFVARGDLDRGVKEKFKLAMLSVHQKDPQAMKSYDKKLEKYVQCDNSFYNQIRNITAILGDKFVADNFLHSN